VHTFVLEIAINLLVEAPGGACSCPALAFSDRGEKKPRRLRRVRGTTGADGRPRYGYGVKTAARPPSSTVWRVSVLLVPARAAGRVYAGDFSRKFAIGGVWSKRSG